MSTGRGLTRFSWPPQCCVPAFLGNAVATLSGQHDALFSEDVRKGLAVALGVTVGPNDANPWKLPVSGDASQWGVRPGDIRHRLRCVAAILGCGSDFSLEIVRLNVIPFQSYEDIVHDMSGRGAIVGISFDYGELRDADARLAGTPQLGRHVARLTPLPGEMDKTPHVESACFAFDYAGDVRIFDDSGEIAEDHGLVSWWRLLHASWMVDGGFWAVMKAGPDGGR